MGVMVPSGDPQSQAVIDLATRLFAAFGYDGTSLPEIAEASGADLNWIHQRFGDKRELYLAVMEHANRAEQSVIQDALSAIPAATDYAGVRAAMYGLVDRYLDFFLANPRMPALWIHRWLGDAADIPGLEETYLSPLINLISGALGSAARAGLIDDQVDLELLVRTLIWNVSGFLHGEAVADTTRSLSADPRMQQRFLSHLHQLIDRMLRPRDA